MAPLYYAHSGVRYLVLLAAVAAVAWFALGLVQKRAYGKPDRIVGSVFLGLLDLQILLGLILLPFRAWVGQMIGHIVMMVVAAAVAHVLFARNRRRPAPSFVLPLVGVAAALVLAVGGIYAMGRTAFGSVPYHDTRSTMR